MILEDGSGVPGADSYVSVDDAATYAIEHGLDFSPSPDIGNEAALVRASTAIDARYRGAFPGYRKAGRDQGLEWPRQAAYDAQGWLISDSEVPIEIINATCEAAVRELAVPGSMMPDISRTIQSVRAGSVSVTYAANAASQTAYTIIDGILSGLLGGGIASSNLFGVAVRG